MNFAISPRREQDLFPIFARSSSFVHYFWNKRDPRSIGLERRQGWSKRPGTSCHCCTGPASPGWEEVALGNGGPAKGEGSTQVHNNSINSVERRRKEETRERYFYPSRIEQARCEQVLAMPSLEKSTLQPKKKKKSRPFLLEVPLFQRFVQEFWS